MLVGLDKPTSGSVLFGGKDLARSAAASTAVSAGISSTCSRTPTPRLTPGMGGLDPARAADRAGHGIQARSAREGHGDAREGRAARAWTERYPHEFSGGQRQRLGFARALLLNPQLIVADEPVSALDVSVQAQVLNMMRDLQKELGLTYMFISHDLSVVRYLSNHIGVMYLGKLVEIGTADEVYLRPAHPYTKGLIESAPTADPETERSKVHEGITGELPSAMHPPTGCRFRTRCPIAQEICSTKEPERSRTAWPTGWRPATSRCSPRSR